MTDIPCVENLVGLLGLDCTKECRFDFLHSVSDMGVGQNHDPLGCGHVGDYNRGTSRSTDLHGDRILSGFMGTEG
jgi:hypothetical protein